MINEIGVQILASGEDRDRTRDSSRASVEPVPGRSASGRSDVRYGRLVRTALCDLLGIDVPILNVGLGGGAPAELAAAVSNAGACGVVGSEGLSPAAVRAQIRKARALADRPFGVNVILAGLSYDGWSSIVVEQVKVCRDEAVPLVVLFWVARPRW